MNENIEAPPHCDRCGSLGEFRGGTCYGCVQTIMELDRAVNDIKGAQILAVYLDEQESELGDKVRRLMRHAIVRLESLRDERIGA